MEKNVFKRLDYLRNLGSVNKKLDFINKNSSDKELMLLLKMAFSDEYVIPKAPFKGIKIAYGKPYANSVETFRVVVHNVKKRLWGHEELQYFFSSVSALEGVAYLQIVNKTFSIGVSKEVLAWHLPHLFFSKKTYKVIKGVAGDIDIYPKYVQYVPSGARETLIIKHGNAHLETFSGMYMEGYRNIETSAERLGERIGLKDHTVIFYGKVYGGVFYIEDYFIVDEFPQEEKPYYSINKIARIESILSTDRVKNIKLMRGVIAHNKHELYSIVSKQEIYNALYDVEYLLVKPISGNEKVIYKIDVEERI